MRTTAVLTCCLLVAALLGAPAVSGAPAASGAPSTHSPATSHGAGVALVQSENVTNVTAPETIEIRIQSDGDARFVLATSFPTATENQRAAFDRLASDFENGEYGRLGFSTYQSIVPAVEEHTGRDMALVDAGPHTSRSGDTGRLEYRFTWTNFASVNDTGVFVGDAFGTGDGLWLRGLPTGQRLAIEAPEGYTVDESPSGPEIDGDALIWTGPTTFESGDLQVTFEEPGSGSILPLQALLALVGVIVVGMVFVAGWWVLQREGEDRPIGDVIGDITQTVKAMASDVADSSGEGTGGSTPVESADGGGTTAVTDVEPSAAADAPKTGEASSDAVDPELLSDEERVENLLEQNGGRMKQANIVTETGWSNAKVSQLLSSMDEEDRVDKLRIGRENLITLPDVDVTDQE